jgi:hypothetical protein
MAMGDQYGEFVTKRGEISRVHILLESRKPAPKRRTLMPWVRQEIPISFFDKDTRVVYEQDIRLLA